MPSKSISTCTWTGDDGNGLSSTVMTVEAVAIPGAACPTEGCGGEVEAWPGCSAGYFTGQREYYSTFHVVCAKCGRKGFPAFYQGDAYRDEALEDAVRQFLDRDSRPHLVLEKA